MPRDLPPLHGLDLNLLVTLRALLREASVTGAADRLGQTQPTVSRALAALRAELGDPLLVRSGRSMILTPFARRLRSPLERAVGALDRLRTVGAFDPATADHAFRLVVPEVLGVLLVAPIHEALASHPGLRLVVLGAELDATQALLDDQVDLVLHAPPLVHPELRTTQVTADMGMSVLAGPRTPVSRGMPLEDWLAADHVQLVPEGRPERPGHLDEVLEGSGRSRRVPLQVSYVSGVTEVLRHRDAVSSLPTPVARFLADIHELQVFPHPLAAEIPALPLRMTWHAIHQDDAAHGWLRQAVTAAIRARLAPPEESAS